MPTIQDNYVHENVRTVTVQVTTDDIEFDEELHDLLPPGQQQPQQPQGEDTGYVVLAKLRRQQQSRPRARQQRIRVRARKL